MKDNPTILVADDDSANLALISELLAMNDFEVVPTADGGEALAKIAENPVDLVVLDVNMPVLDGFAVIQKLRSEEKTRLLPVILVTGLNATEDRIRGIEAGCDDFISKPFNSGELLARIQALLKINYYRSLLDEKEKFEYILEHIDYGVVVLNRNLQTVRVNRKAREWLSLEEADLSHDFFLRLTDQFELRTAGDLAKEIAETPLIFDVARPETEAHRPLIISVQSSVVRDPARQVSSILLLMTDVTELRKEEYRKEVFMSIVSHKLRTPLAVIQGTLSLLGEKILGPLTEKQEKAIATLEKQSTVYKEMIDRLLGSASVFDEQIGGAKEKILLKEYLATHLDRLGKELREKRVTFRLSCSPDDLSLPLDLEHFGLAIQHIVDNAIRHATQETVEIEIVASRRDPNVEIAIYDNGPGIPPEEREKAFKSFYQVSKWDTGNVRGFGLGLAVVKHIVEAHGGKVELKSAGEKGSACVLTLPS